MVVSPRAGSLLPGMQSTSKPATRGVLPYQSIRKRIESGAIQGDGDGIEESQVQPASLDLRLGDVAYQVRASVLPGKHAGVLDAASELIIQELSLCQSQVLQKGGVYLIPVLETLKLPPGLTGRANPKSTTGRLDVFARLITDGADQFDSVAQEYRGALYVEVAPKTFHVRVRRGTRLNQLRFLSKRPAQLDASQKAARAGEPLVYSKQGDPLKATIRRGVWLTVDLAETPGEVIGWKARLNAPVVDFDEVDFYDATDFWEPILAQERPHLILNPGEFYLLGSREKVRVPPAFAAEMIPYDPAMGEFRAHYAGFFDPGFGFGAQGEIHGTRAILEVRSYDVPYLLRDGQSIAHLVYEGLLETPSKLYGAGVASSYQQQRLGLGKQFRWV